MNKTHCVEVQNRGEMVYTGPGRCHWVPKKQFYTENLTCVDVGTIFTVLGLYGREEDYMIVSTRPDAVFGIIVEVWQ